MSAPIRQFDVFPNPIVRLQSAYPFVVVLQSDRAETGANRLVAFLAPRSALPSAAGRLMPIIDSTDEPFVLLLPSLTTVPAGELRDLAGNIAGYRERILEALDFLFVGP